MKKRVYLILAILILMLGSLSAKHSDKYLLANYTLLRCYQNVPGWYYTLLDSIQAAKLMLL